jgi:hypothetical protein
MSRFHRRLAIAACVAFAGAAIAAIPALGAIVKINSKVTISNNAPAFHGRVKSSNTACEQQRKVKLFKQRSGADKLLGKDKTNHHGKWEIVVQPLKSGAYYAKVVRREEGTAGTTFVCRGDRSRTIVID